MDKICYNCGAVISEETAEFCQTYHVEGEERHWCGGCDLGDSEDAYALEEQEQDEPSDGFLTDAEADADALASAGWGTDEDYNHYEYEGEY